MRKGYKSLSLVLVFVVLLCSLPLSVTATEKTEDNQISQIQQVSTNDNDEFNDGILTYYICDGIACVSGRNDKSVKEIVIPDTVEFNGSTYDVTRIEVHAFAYSELTSITIGNKIDVIRKNALYECNLSKGIYIHSLDQWLNISFWDSRFDSHHFSPYALYLNGELVKNLDNIITTSSKIKEGVFANCTSLESINIPNNITSIEKYAFSGCINLKSINIPNSVKNISSLTNYHYQNGGTFYGCINLTSIEIPDSVSTIEYGTFEDCTNLTSIVIPNSITKICGYAFAGCTKLSSITIPNAVKEIEGYAFENCTNLTSINIPDSVTSLPNSYYGDVCCTCFSGCKNLEKINVSESNQNYSSDSNGLLYNKSKSKLLLCPAGYKSTSIDFPDELKEIGGGAFNDCANLVTLIIPDNIIKISAGWEDSPHPNCALTFNCENLKTVSLGSGLTNIESGLFSNCKNLQSVTIGVNVSSIGDYVFSGCTKITSLTLPDSVTTIGNGTFSNCVALNQIAMPGEVNSIGAKAFYNCKSLNSFVIPDNVQSVGTNAFENCINLSSVKIGKGLKQIGERMFYGCIDLKTVTIPDNVISIEKNAFYGCISLGNVALSNSLTTIADDAFCGCVGLASITVPNSVTTIGDYALGWINSSVSGVKQRISGFTIYGTKGTAAETYATQNGFTFVEVGGGDTEIKIKPGSSYVINNTNGYVSHISEKTTKADFLNNFSNSNIDVFSANGEALSDSDNVGTGCVVKATSNGNAISTATVVVTGDVDGNGEIDIFDVFGILDHINNKTVLTGAKEKATLVDSEDEASIFDVFAVLDYINGKRTIEPRAI